MWLHCYQTTPFNYKSPANLLCIQRNHLTTPRYRVIVYVVDPERFVKGHVTI